MFDVKMFVKDISNLSKTRKFWTGLLGVVVGAVVTHLASQPELGAIFQLLGVIGVYQVSNTKK